MTLIKSTTAKALGLSVLVISTALIGSIIYNVIESNKSPWPDDLPGVDIFDWADNDAMSSKHILAFIYQADPGLQSGVMPFNLSSLSLYYNVSNTGNWRLSAVYTHEYNASGRTRLDFDNYILEYDDPSEVMSSLKPTILALKPYTTKIEADDEGINTIIEKAGDKYLRIKVVTEDGVSIEMQIFQFGIIMTASWMYYQLRRYNETYDYDVQLADQALVDALYTHNEEEIQEFQVISTTIPKDYYYFVEMPNPTDGLQIEYIQAWNSLITAIQY